MLYSSSPHGRLLMQSIYTDDPYNIDIHLNDDDKRMLCNIIDELEYSNSIIRQCIVYPYNYGTISDKIYNGDFIFGSATTTDNIRDIVKSMFDEYNLFSVS